MERPPLTKIVTAGVILGIAQGLTWLSFSTTTLLRLSTMPVCTTCFCWGVASFRWRWLEHGLVKNRRRSVIIVVLVAISGVFVLESIHHSYPFLNVPFGPYGPGVFQDYSKFSNLTVPMRLPIPSERDTIELCMGAIGFCLFAPFTVAVMVTILDVFRENARRPWHPIFSCSFTVVLIQPVIVFAVKWSYVWYIDNVVGVE